MPYADTVATQLYPLYCDYIDRVNRSISLCGAKIPAVDILSRLDFLAMWSVLPESRRVFWQSRFEAGHDEVAALERHKLAAAFTSSNLDRPEFEVARAA
jgi:hypothetical protein